MFSVEEKQHIADVIEKALLGLNHPEMPKERPVFKIHIDGKESWSWADIEPNWKYQEEDDKRATTWNEIARDVLCSKDKNKENDDGTGI